MEAMTDVWPSCLQLLSQPVRTDGYNLLPPQGTLESAHRHGAKSRMQVLRHAAGLRDTPASPMLSLLSPLGWATPTQPILRMSFAADIWTLQNSSDSLFVNQTVHVAVSDSLGAIAQNDSLKDGRLAASVGFHSPQAASSAAGVYALDPFFGRIACYLYPPTLVGDPSHITITWPMALQLLFGGVDLAIYNRSSYHGTTSFDGRECELWVAGFNTSDEASFCVQRSSGLLLSANHTAYQGNIHEISRSVLSNIEPINPTTATFDVPDKKGCVDLRPLPQLDSAVEEKDVAPEDEAATLVDDPARLARINRAIRAAGASWTTAAPSSSTMTVADARARVQQGGVLTSNPYSVQHIGRRLRDRASAVPAHQQPTLPVAAAAAATTSTTPLPESFDARTEWKGCASIATVRSQGKCGSCWAFSSAEALSDRFCAQSGANLSLSVEFLMDCNVVNNGCAGGLLDDSWKFMATTGLPTESCVPYQEEAGPLPTGPIPCGAVQRCLPGGAGPKDFLLHAAKGGAYPVGSFTGDAEGMQRDLMANGPISVAFQVRLQRLPLVLVGRLQADGGGAARRRPRRQGRRLGHRRGGRPVLDRRQLVGGELGDGRLLQDREGRQRVRHRADARGGDDQVGARPV